MSKLEALRTFEQRLRDLKEDFERNTTDGVQGWQRRGLAHHSLTAVIELVESLELPPRADRGFTLLHEALWEIEKGNKVPVWLTNTTPGRPPLSERVVLLRARCAAVMEFLMTAGGKDRESAARLVKRYLPKQAEERLGVKSWRSIAEWRDGLIGSIEPERADELSGFNNILSTLDTMQGDASNRASKILQAIGAAASNG